MVCFSMCSQLTGKVCMLQSQSVGRVDLSWLQTQQDGEMPDECLWILQRCLPSQQQLAQPARVVCHVGSHRSHIPTFQGSIGC